MASVGFIQVGPEGICFAHGPYLNQCPKWPTCGEAPKQQKFVQLAMRPISEWFPERTAEHARLERAVVEAAKKWRWATNRGTNAEATALQHPLAKAVDELRRFEAAQNLGKQE